MLFDKRFLSAEGVDPDSLAGVIPLLRVFDLRKGLDDTPDGGAPTYIHPPFGSQRPALEDASPMRHLRDTRVPLLVVLAGEDYQAMQRQSREFVDALRQLRLGVTFETVPGRTHFDLVGAMGQPGDPTTDLISGFTLKPP